MITIHIFCYILIMEALVKLVNVFPSYSYCMLCYITVKPVFSVYLQRPHMNYLNPFCWNKKSLDYATSIEPDQTAQMCRLAWLYTVGWPTSSSHLDIPKMIIDSSKSGRWTSPFQKFSRSPFNIIMYIFHVWEYLPKKNTSLYLSRYIFEGMQAG